MKIFILKPSSLGDVVQALPVLRLLKKHFPQSQIYWWLEARLAPLLEEDPDLERLIVFDRQRWGRPWHWPDLWRELRLIREQGMDWVIDLQSLFRSGLAAWLANGSLTVGLDDPREGARGFYDVSVRRASYHTHAVDWYLEVLRHLNVPIHWEFEWLPQQAKAAANIRQKWNVDKNRWIVLQPGARWPNKRWPVEHFVSLVRTVSQKEPELMFAILGSSADRELGEAIMQACPKRSLNLAGQISLPEMVEWIRASELMVSNDTGPMHVAAALRKPVLAVFGPTEPRRTGPYGQISQAVQLDLPCVPCMKDRCSFAKPLECLRGISPALISERVLEVLAHKP